MQVARPPESLPEIGTTANPAVFWDGNDAFIGYEASASSKGGNVVLKFREVIDFRVTPMNAEGLEGCRYPIAAWAFNEISGGAETAEWKSLNPRLWLISFRDVTIEVLFQRVRLMHRSAKPEPPRAALVDFLREPVALL